MQQVLVHSDNPQLRTAVRDIVQRLFPRNLNEDVIKEIEDFILPTLVVTYYSKGLNQDFLEYLKTVNAKKISYKNIIGRINRYLYNLPSNTEKILLGDIHPGDVSKYLYHGKVEYSNYPDYGKLLERIAALILEDSEKIFPQITKNKKQFSRNYIETSLEASTRKNVERFYENLGKAIPIILLLRGVDINAENIIVHLPYPVLFDMESIMSGTFESDLGDYGIGNSGIVKTLDKNDSSVLTGGIQDRESLLKPLICGTPEKPYIGWRTKSKGKYFNIPTLNNTKVSPREYVEYLKEGFNKSVQKILDNRRKIRSIIKEENAVVRVIIRPTRMYRLFILKSCYPEIYTKNDMESYLRNELEECGYIYKIKAQRLLENEVKVLSNFQIPVFYSDIKQKDIFSANGDTVALWDYSPYEIWLDYFNNLDEKFFEAQLKIITKSLI